MALLTKAQFAEKIERASNYLATYIGRGEVIIHSGEGKLALIDDQHPVNQTFLLKKGAKNMAKAPVNEPKPEVFDAVVLDSGAKKKVPSNGKDANDVVMKNLALLEQEKAELAVQKQREELDKIRLHNEKARGESLPIALFNTLYARSQQHSTTTFKNFAEAWLTNIAKKKEFTLEEIAEASEFLFKGINNSLSEAAEMTKQNLESLIEDYKESIK